MNGMQDHRRWRADLAAYLLGALEPGETAELETHLEGCSRCREELRWLAPAVDRLPESIEQLDPPPELRDRLLEQVRSDAAVASSGGEDAPAARGAFSLRRFMLRPAVALGVVALGAAAIGGYSLRGSGGEDEATSVAAAEGSGAIRATVESAGDEATLKMTGLQQAPPEHVYQAWVQHDEKVQPVGLFDARHNGTANVAIPHGMQGADAVMVTVEPRGGSRRPESAALVNVALSN